MSDERLVVITGVSRGLGRALANGFMRAGHTVVGCARSAAAIAELGEQANPPHRFDVVDVADPSQVEAWAASVLEDQGPPDVLINAAALINRNAPLWKISPAEFSQVVDVNIKGVYHTIAEFVPAMVERGTGIVVNFSSYWGRSTSADVAPYCATKWAIEGLSRGLANDLPAGMASIAFNPGVVHTEMLESCFGESASSYPSPDSWAEAAVPFILGFDAKDNGQAVTVPGF